MKLTISLLILSISILSFTQTSATNLEEQKTQILQMSSGNKLLIKLDTAAQKIVEKSQQSDTFRRAFNTKLIQIQSRYIKKTDTKSQKIVIILSYLEAKIDSGLAITSSRILTRLQKIEANKYKNKASSRTNKLKAKKYTRIQIKK